KSDSKPPVISSKERRRIEAEKRKLKSKDRKEIETHIAQIEAEIVKLEGAQTLLNEQLTSSNAYADMERAKELNQESARITKQLKKRNEEWELAIDKLSQFTSV
ncbi:MAG: division protein CdvB (Snf7/Vps24/ESCRT-III family), partial [Lentimonas sp.]